MISITRLLCGGLTPGDALRYGRDSSQLPAHLLRFSQDKRPVVVWNSTRRCNLHCIHCYAEAQERPHPQELSTAEAEGFIDSLAAYGAPVLLFSGGEPLTRDDLFPLIRRAAQKGMRAVVSTNGTLITPAAAQQLSQAGVSYVGVSIDGLEPTHDHFRGKRGAFQEALRGIRNCLDAGVRTGVRFTLTRHNFRDIRDIFRLIEEEGIPRMCFYHLVYTGRGAKLREEDLSHEETRQAVDTIFQETRRLHGKGLDKDILTVDNHADGVYLYLQVKDEDPQRAQDILQLLRWNGGNSSGVGIACVDEKGNVHADQFWRHYSFGNIRERAFAGIWGDVSDPVMKGLKDRKPLLKGRCALCRYLEICGGNLRVRAEAVYGDLWAPDPACYLTDQEIGLVPEAV